MKKFKNLKLGVDEERWVTEQVNFICKGLKGGARFKREFCVTLNASGFRSSTGGYHGGGARGAYPRIKINDNYLGLDDKYTYFHEYKSIEKSKVIGAMGAEGDLCYMALIAHELAHAIVGTAQSTDWLVLKPEWIPKVVTSRTWTGHGKVWQRVYGVLREEFVNEHAERLGQDAIIFGDPERRTKKKRVKKVQTKKDKTIYEQGQLILAKIEVCYAQGWEGGKVFNKLQEQYHKLYPSA